MVITDKLCKGRKTSRWNKNKKKNWRKKIDISAIEDGLDKDRLELRTGGLAKHKANNELFVIEKIAVKHVSSALKYKREKRLMVDKIIIPEPDAVKSPTNYNAAKLRRQENRRKLLNQLQKPENVKQDKSFSKHCKTDEDKDIWKKAVDDIAADVFNKNKIVKHTENVLSKTQLKRPNHLYKKPDLNIKAVEVSHPGSSYNPSLNDHQELLRTEHEKELGKLKISLKIERAVSTDPLKIATKESDQADMAQGLFDISEDSFSEQDAEIDSNGVIKNPPVRREDKKTLRKRKTEAKLKHQKRIRELLRMEKVRDNDVYRIKSLLAQIKTKEEKEYVKKMKRNLVVKRPVLSSTKYEEPDSDLQLSSEVQGSLRKLKPEGCIMFDRYKSLQKRCIIEPRKKFKAPKKNKIKYSEKRSFAEIVV